MCRREIFGARAADDPAAALAWERARRERDELYRPRLLIDVSLQAEAQREREQARAHLREQARREAKERAERERERYLRAQASRQLPTEAEPIDSDDSASPPPGTPPPPSPVTPPRKHKHHHHRHEREQREHELQRALDAADADERGDADNTDTPQVLLVRIATSRESCPPDHWPLRAIQYCCSRAWSLQKPVHIFLFKTSNFVSTVCNKSFQITRSFKFL